MKIHRETFIFLWALLKCFCFALLFQFVRVQSINAHHITSEQAVMEDSIVITEAEPIGTRLDTKQESVGSRFTLEVKSDFLFHTILFLLQRYKIFFRFPNFSALLSS